MIMTGDLNKDELNELGTMEFEETEAGQLINNGDIAVITTGDGHQLFIEIIRRPTQNNATDV